MKPIETIQQAKLYIKCIPAPIHSCLQTTPHPDLLMIHDYVKAIKLLEDNNVPIPDYLQKTIIDEINKHINGCNYHPDNCPCNLCLKEKPISTPIEALSSMAYYMALLLELLRVYYKKDDSHSMLLQESKQILKEVNEKFLTEQNP